MIKDLIEVFWGDTTSSSEQGYIAEPPNRNELRGSKWSSLCDGLLKKQAQSWLIENTDYAEESICSLQTEVLREVFVSEAIKKAVKEARDL